RILGLPPLPPAEIARSHVFHLYVVRAPRRDALRDHLASRHIGSGVYYPVPLHLQPCFAGLGYPRGELPEAARAADALPPLPLYTELTSEQQERVVEAVRSFYR